jgi:GT2 family glycosyltransferase
MIDLAVIVVTWNVREMALAAVGSLLADLDESGFSSRVIVVDSASTDGTVDALQSRFLNIDVIASDVNLGFVRANNLALRRLGFGQGQPIDELPRAVYLLNPDTLTHSGATRRLFDALMSDSKIGLVGARLEYGDGAFQHSAFMFPGLSQLWVEFFPTPGRLIEGRFNGRYPRRLYDGADPFEIDFVLGATMMLKREVIERVGMFDEDFFMYCEEIDWAWRIRRAGWSVWCVPAARVTHYGGASSGQARPQTLRHLWESRLRLIDKHYPRWKALLARRLIALGMARKMRSAAPQSAEAYAHIRRLASS